MRLSYTAFAATLLVATVVSEQGVRVDKEERVHWKHGNAPENPLEDKAFWERELNYSYENDPEKAPSPSRSKGSRGSGSKGSSGSNGSGSKGLSGSKGPKG